MLVLLPDSSIVPMTSHGHHKKPENHGRLTRLTYDCMNVLCTCLWINCNTSILLNHLQLFTISEPNKFYHIEIKEVIWLDLHVSDTFERMRTVSSHWRISHWYIWASHCHSCRNVKKNIFFYKQDKLIRPPQFSPTFCSSMGFGQAYSHLIDILWFASTLSLKLASLSAMFCGAKGDWET